MDVSLFRDSMIDSTFYIILKRCSPVGEVDV
jgi:hypothetical protein